MPFFTNAHEISIDGGTMNDIQGNQTNYNGTVNDNRSNYNNTTTTTTTGSFNDNSTRIVNEGQSWNLRQDMVQNGLERPYRNPSMTGPPPRGTGRRRPVAQQGRNLQWNPGFHPEHSAAYAAGQRASLPRMPHSSPDVLRPVHGQIRPFDFNRPIDQGYYNPDAFRHHPDGPRRGYQTSDSVAREEGEDVDEEWVSEDEDEEEFHDAVEEASPSTTAQPLGSNNPYRNWQPRPVGTYADTAPAGSMRTSAAGQGRGRAPS